jgi:hypothetical protein
MKDRESRGREGGRREGGRREGGREGEGRKGGTEVGKRFKIFLKLEVLTTFAKIIERLS